MGYREMRIQIISSIVDLFWYIQWFAKRFGTNWQRKHFIFFIAPNEQVLTWLENDVSLNRLNIVEMQ